MAQHSFRKYLAKGKPKVRDYEALAAPLAKAAEASGYHVQQFGETAGGHGLLAVVGGDGDTIAVTAGIHGDEPAGPLAALRFLRETPAESLRHRLVLLPCLNPGGWEADARRNRQNLDLNRQLCGQKTRRKTESGMAFKLLKASRPRLLVSMHEDSSVRGHYVYYWPEGLEPLARSASELARKWFGPHPADKVHGKANSDGLVAYKPSDSGGCTLEDRLSIDVGVPVITTESPSTAPLQDRIDWAAEFLRRLLGR